MQKVSIEQLKMLLPEKNQAISESDIDVADGLSFKKLCNEYGEIKKIYKGDVELTYDVFKGVLEEYAPPITLVGQGSSRAVFACKGGKCIKVAVNDAGTAQNLQEYSHTAKRWWRREYQCFARSYAKSKEGNLLLSECCAPAKSYRQLFGALGVNDIEQLGVAFIAMTELGGKDAGEVSRKLQRATNGQKLAKIKNYLFNVKAAEAACEWLNSVNAGMEGEAWPLIIRELQKFWNKYGAKELLPSDLTQLENWGFTIRYGKISPVVIDAGFSEAVADSYYK